MTDLLKALDEAIDRARQDRAAARESEPCGECKACESCGDPVCSDTDCPIDKPAECEHYTLCVDCELDYCRDCSVEARRWELADEERAFAKEGGL